MSGQGGDLVRDAADLARLPPPEPAILDACRRVVAAFSDLPEHDGPPQPPRHPAGTDNGLRDDEPRPGLTPEEALAAAPDTVDGVFRAPRVRDVR